MCQFEDVVITHFLRHFMDLQNSSVADLYIISCLMCSPNMYEYMLVYFTGLQLHFVVIFGKMATNSKLGAHF